MEHHHRCKEQIVQMVFFFFTNVSDEVSPSKEPFCLLCVGACSLARTPATAIKSLHAETFLFLEFVVYLLCPLGKISFQSVEELMFFFISSQLCLHVQLETMCLFQFYASGSCQKDKSVVSLLCYKLPYQNVLS